MKVLFSKILTYLIRPFYGSGLGKYTPFRQLNILYVRISQERERTTETTSGFKMYVQYGKYIDTTIASTGIWEPHITKLIQNTLKKGDVCIDVGANIGYDTLLAASCVGEAGQVLSFEPGYENHKQLLKNIKLNDFRNIRAFQVGLGSTNFETNLYIDDINPGAASVLPFRRKDTGIKSSTIHIKVFDEMFPSQKCDLLKIDIEGYELEALRGMKHLLEYNKNMKIILEYSPILYSKINSPENIGEELLRYLQDLGFKIHHINEDGTYSIIESISQYYDRVCSEGGQADIYCLR